MVRVDAVRALGRLGGRAPLDRLLTAAEDRTSDIRAAAMTALGQLGERAPVDVLVHGLGDESPWVRVAAADALGQPGIMAPVDALLRALADTSANVRASAAAAVARLSSDQLTSVSEEGHRLIADTTANPDTFPILGALIEGGAADRIAEAGTFSAAYVAYLGMLLNRPYWAVRMRAARALGRIRRGVPDTILQRLYELRHDPTSRAASHASDDALAEILSFDPVEDDEDDE